MLDRDKQQSDAVPVPDRLDPDVVVSPDTRRALRLPPNQARTKKWPVLDAHGTPSMDPARWKLDVSGLVDAGMSYTLSEFRELPRVKVFADMHCVTRWSRLGNLWEGVSTRELLSRSKVLDDARYVVIHAYDRGWTTNVPLEALLEEDVLLADKHDGLPISADHGGPVRLMIPRLYAWKSAKWVKRIELVSEDRAGFWEAGGYHMLGDPWLEQRYRSGS